MGRFLALLFYFFVVPAVTLPVMTLTILVFRMLFKRDLRMPFSVVDMMIPFLSLGLWVGVGMVVPFVHKRLGNLIELSLLGALFAFLLIIRIPLCMFFPQKQKLIVYITCIVHLIISVLSALFVPATLE